MDQLQRYRQLVWSLSSWLPCLGEGVLQDESPHTGNLLAAPCLSTQSFIFLCGGFISALQSKISSGLSGQKLSRPATQPGN